MAIRTSQESDTTIALQKWFRDTFLANPTVQRMVEQWASLAELSVIDGTSRLALWVSGLLAEEDINGEGAILVRHEKAGFGLCAFQMFSILPLEFSCNERSVRNKKNLCLAGVATNDHHHSISFLNVDMSRLGYTRLQTAELLLTHISGGGLMDGFTLGLLTSKTDSPEPTSP
jgi:hypothetical protein